MNILLLVDDFLPSQKSAPLLMHYLASALSHKGHHVVLLTPAGQWRTCHNDTKDGYEVFRFPSGKLKNISHFRRAINESLLPWGLLWCYLFHHKIFKKAQLLIAYSPTIFWGPFNGLLKLFSGITTYLILRDIFPQWAIDDGILRKHSLITWYFRFFEKWNYLFSDKIAVEMPKNLNYFKHSVFQKKTTVLYNWFDTSEPLLFDSSIRTKYGLEEKVVFLYGGNLGLAQDMDNLMRLARVMKDYPQAHFLFVGAGDAYSLIEQRIAEWALSNVTLRPSVSQEDYYKLLSQCDVGLLSLHPNHTLNNLPGKALGYMAYGKPILASLNQGNDLISIFHEHNAGLCSVNPDDSLLLSNAVRLLDASTRTLLGTNARHLLESKFNVNSIAQTILKDSGIVNIS